MKELMETGLVQAWAVVANLQDAHASIATFKNPEEATAFAALATASAARGWCGDPAHRITFSVRACTPEGRPAQLKGISTGAFLRRLIEAERERCAKRTP